MFLDNKWYPVLIIVAFVGLAIIVMFWALYGTSGARSMDATKRPAQTAGSHL
jgi:ABC-type multidrug transport system permease subunit